MLTVSITATNARVGLVQKSLAVRLCAAYMRKARRYGIRAGEGTHVVYDLTAVKGHAMRTSQVFSRTSSYQL